jgi:serine/threonine protein kinase/tetratricopeptide (TPR) repeat protein
MTRSALNGSLALEELLEEFAGRLEAGEALDVAAFAAAHPEHAEQLRRVLPTMLVLADLGRSASAGGSASPSSGTDPEPTTGVLGDFRILRQVGRGGMGVVYEAEQISLGRRVALKVLPFAATMDPRHLQRFHNEARAAASLHHPNIVPVHAVGEERGVHYYAMQFIAGQTLAAFIEQQRDSGTASQPTVAQVTPPAADTAAVAAAPTELAPRDRAYFRRAAEWGIQAAEALEHAHQLGVVHRDIKPANLMIDGRGQLWVADFGLARTAAESGLTMSGDLVGTLRYMSPEQALAKRVVIDHRTDVYSLGATVYELLTLRPAFEGADRQELLRQIAFEEPRPLRRLNRAVPAELEIIVQKATEKNPAERYATAQDMADDLRSWLADRPILARRPGPAQRLARWTRRHRALVSATVVCLFVASVALAISTVMAWRKERETANAYHAADEQRRVATEQRQRAVDSLKDAEAAVDQLLMRVGRDKLADVPYAEPIRRELLADAVRFYEKFLERNNDDPELRLEVARARLGLGEIEWRLGEYHRAEEKLRQGLALLHELLAQQPGRPEYLHELAHGWHSLGLVKLAANQLGEAEEVLKTAREFATQHVADAPDSLDALDLLAIACADLGTTYARGGRLQPAAESYREALGRCQQVTAASPENLAHQQTLATVTANLGTLLAQLGHNEEGEKRLREAVVLQEQLVSKEGGPQQRGYLANFYRDLALRQRSGGRLKEAIESFQKGLKLCSQLHSEFPHVPDYAHAYGQTLFFTGQTLMRRGGDAPALECLNDSEHLYLQLAKDFPTRREYRQELSWCSFERGWLLAASYDAKVRNPAAAIEPAKRAVELAPEGGKHWAALGMAYYRAGQWPDALRALEEASRRPQPANRLDLLFLAMTHWRMGHKDEARELYHQAVAWMDKHPVQEPQLDRFRAEAAELLGLVERPKKEKEESPRKD